MMCNDRFSRCRPDFQLRFHKCMQYDRHNRRHHRNRDLYPRCKCPHIGVTAGKLITHILPGRQEQNLLPRLSNFRQQLHGGDGTGVIGCDKHIVQYQRHMPMCSSPQLNQCQAKCQCCVITVCTAQPGQLKWLIVVICANPQSIGNGFQDLMALPFGHPLQETRRQLEDRGHAA